MHKKKVCMIGDFAVGKTSLTQKFVNNVFSDKYLTTVGVKIDTAIVGDTKLVVWDVAGRDALSPINANYLVGAAAVVLVADGTRPETVQSLADLWQIIESRIGSVPAVVAINKADVDGWQAPAETEHGAVLNRWQCFETSAKDGRNVDALFEALVDKMLADKV